MYGSLFSRASAAVAVAFFVTFAASPAAAQSSADAQHPPPAQVDSGDQQPQHDMQHMHMENDQGMAMPQAREGSGTSWLPDETPMYAIHGQAGDWTLMTHGNAFLQYL